MATSKYILRQSVKTIFDIRGSIIFSFVEKESNEIIFLKNGYLKIEPAKNCQNFHNFLISQLLENRLITVVNTFLANAPILYSLKTPKNFWFSGVFRGYKMGTLARNGLTGGCTLIPVQLAFTCSKLTIETVEQGVKYVQS